MDSKVFQAVFDMIVEFIPENWKKIIFTAMYSKGSYSMKFYYHDGDKYMDCFSIPGVQKLSLVKTFMEIDKVLAKNSGNDKERWTVFTMIVDEAGNMKTEFEYEDHTEDMIRYEQEWQKKYLK